MRYHIDTIPVWDALRAQSECPLCLLWTKTQQLLAERFLGGSVMESDTRIQVNRAGFCCAHQSLLYAQQNRLSHALLMHTHLLETLHKIEELLPAQQPSGKPSFWRVASRTHARDANQTAQQLRELSGNCILCQQLQDTMNRYLYTYVHLWHTDGAFRQAAEASKGVCIPHAADLAQMVADAFSSQQAAAFVAAMVSQLKASLQRVGEELEWFTLKFDYRNADKPWNNSRDALERAILKLRGCALGAAGTATSDPAAPARPHPNT